MAARVVLVGGLSIDHLRSFTPNFSHLLRKLIWISFIFTNNLFFIYSSTTSEGSTIRSVDNVETSESLTSAQIINVAWINCDLRFLHTQSVANNRVSIQCTSILWTTTRGEQLKLHSTNGFLRSRLDRQTGAAGKGILGIILIQIGIQISNYPLIPWRVDSG